MFAGMIKSMLVKHLQTMKASGSVKVTFAVEDGKVDVTVNSLDGTQEFYSGTFPMQSLIDYINAPETKAPVTT